MSEENQEIFEGSEDNNYIPNGAVIKDQEAYKKFLEVRNSDILTDPWIHFSDDSMKPIHPTLIIKKGHKWWSEHIEHLPEEEIEEINSKVAEYAAKRGQYSTLSRLAFDNSPKVVKEFTSYDFIQQKATEVIEYFGSFLNEKEVLKILNKEYDTDIAPQSLKRFYYENEKTILKRREEYKREWQTLKLSHKRAWIEELQELYFDRKQIYLEEGKNRLDYIQLLNTLKLVRDVAVDAGQRIDIHVEGQVEVAITHTIDKEILKNISILEIIVGRTASKLGIPSHKMIERLHKSIYSKFNGVGTTSLEEMNETPIYPSQMVYDWTKIEKIHLETPQTQVEDVEYETVTEEDMQRGKRILSIIDNKIKENRQFTNLMQTKIKRNTD